MELWFLLSSFDFVDVETVPVLGVKKTTLVFRATMQNTALGSDEKLITSKWNCGLIPQSIAVLDRLPACSLIL